MNPILKRLVPDDFRPLLNCISPTAFQVVDWRGVLKFAPTLSNRAVSRSGVYELGVALRPYLPPALRLELEEVKTSTRVGPELGSLLLEVYFSQFYCPSGVFLDLRAQRFLPAGEVGYHWLPNGLWVQFADDFRIGMIEIYEGYYLGDLDTMRIGLAKVGLVSSELPVSKAREVEKMLLSHIGGQTEAQVFKVKDFVVSFEKLFRFLSENKIFLRADFLFLGAYLAGLYTHLEELSGEYDVKSAFLRARSRALAVRSSKSAQD